MAEERARTGSESEESSRDRILQAAEDEFAAKGFAGVRIDEITRLADVNKQLIYYYFGSKMGLYEAVLDRLVKEREGYWAAASAAAFDEAMTIITSSSSKNWPRLLSWEGSQFHLGDGSISQADVRRERYAVQTGIFSRAQESGRIDSSLDPEMLSILLSAVNLSAATLPQIVTLVTGLEPSSAEYAEKMRSFVKQLMEMLRPR